MNILIDGKLAEQARWGHVAGDLSKGVLVATLEPEGSYCTVEIRVPIDDPLKGERVARAMPKGALVNVLAHKLWPRTSHATFAVIVENVAALRVGNGEDLLR